MRGLGCLAFRHGTWPVAIGAPAIQQAYVYMFADTPIPRRGDIRARNPETDRRRPHAAVLWEPKPEL